MEENKLVKTINTIIKVFALGVKSLVSSIMTLIWFNVVLLIMSSYVEDLVYVDFNIQGIMFVGLFLYEVYTRKYVMTC